ncbi:porin [Thiohalobacter sp. IOR34]|uniref:porin n=1 Tax=Thiohalobacter sp. IOR34 TaxID=3057176 RepID=UPI0025B13568|nr:porin [Thiohalobacter sp. IOR34]WJW74275.1 porin [Thiohalobacter sp. IOR34]
MNRKPGNWRQAVLALAIGSSLPVSAMADSELELLKQQVELLQQQLQEVQARLEQQAARAATKQEVAALKEDVNAAAEWKSPNSLVHMAGYADVGYTNSDGNDGAFNAGTFAPIFHYQYRDLVMLESELEFKITDAGDTEVGLEYLTADLFINDYMTLVAGKFLSPTGQFRQNLHPSWINKLPSAPPGFGHDGAAPISDVGLQLRGGMMVGGIRTNYAVYVGNGPELEAVDEGGDVELEGILAEGHGSDRDGDKVVGGRLGLLPVPNLEIGLSAVSGKASVTAQSGDSTLAFADLGSEPARDYDVVGADFWWRWQGLETRAEYVRSKIGSAAGSVAPDGATWKSWYAQAAYRFAPTQWEAVLRYTDFDSPHAVEDKKQWAMGVNYLFASNVVGKLAYESNDGQSGSTADDDRWLVQLGYGF